MIHVVKHGGVVSVSPVEMGITVKLRQRRCCAPAFVLEHQQVNFTNNPTQNQVPPEQMVTFGNDEDNAGQNKHEVIQLSCARVLNGA